MAPPAAPIAPPARAPPARPVAAPPIAAPARPPMAAPPTARSPGVSQAATESVSAAAAITVVNFLIGSSLLGYGSQTRAESWTPIDSAIPPNSDIGGNPGIVGYEALNGSD